jgi:hypothetical protein
MERRMRHSEVIGVWSDRQVVQLKRGGVALFLWEVGGREFQGGWGLDCAKLLRNLGTGTLRLRVPRSSINSV